VLIEDNMFKKFINYCKACYDELAHKTTWPTRKELTHSAMVVFICFPYHRIDRVRYGLRILDC